ncbi:MAG: helix-turn-helix domain-containing protein [Lactovum sp.]
MKNQDIEIKKHSTVLYHQLFDSKYEFGVRLQDFDKAFSEHYHNYIEIVCQLNATSVQIVNKQTYDLKEGEILVIHPGESHENLATKSTVLNLIVSEKFLSNLVIDSTFDDSILHIKNIISSPKQRQVYLLTQEAQDILNEIYYLFLKQSRISMYYLRQKINISSFFIALEKVTGIMDKEVKLNSLDLISYMENNLEVASLNDFSKLCNYSPSLISQKIKQQYEMTFVEILQELRLKKAARLLTNSDENIDQIMSMIGYSNKTHFYALFKEKYSQTPNQYRKSHLS